MKLLSAVIALGLIVGVNTAQAQKKKALIDSADGQGYGMAGCGLGSVVFGDKPGIIQVFAATTNGVSGNQTFGISTGTLNCGDTGKLVKAEQYIDVNKVALENDMARGQGESLTALSEVLECSNSNFAAELKNNYKSAFPQGGASAQQISAVAYKACAI